MPGGMTESQREQYSRQIRLREVGLEGQARWLRSRVEFSGELGPMDAAQTALEACGLRCQGSEPADLVVLASAGASRQRPALLLGSGRGPKVAVFLPAEGCADCVEIMYQAVDGMERVEPWGASDQGFVAALISQIVLLGVEGPPRAWHQTRLHCWEPWRGLHCARHRIPE